MNICYLNDENVEDDGHIIFIDYLYDKHIEDKKEEDCNKSDE